MAVKFRSELDPLSPYGPPRAANEAAAERGAEDYVKLTSNELSFGPLPEAEAALAEALPRANRYPDRYVASLREEVVSAVKDETRAVIVSNPNNPTGTYLTSEEVRALAEALPDNALLILDEAYQEFVSDPAYAGSHVLALEMENVVCVRTFSKAHGLAGFRAGYGIAGQRVADYVERVRFPFSV